MLMENRHLKSYTTVSGKEKGHKTREARKIIDAPNYGICTSITPSYESSSI